VDSQKVEKQRKKKKKIFLIKKIKFKKEFMKNKRWKHFDE